MMKYYLKHYKSNVPNANISLKKLILVQTLLGNIKNPLSRKHSDPLAEYNTLYFWDLGKKASESIKIGDTLYIVTKDDIYCGVINVHIRDPQGGIGDAIGWARQFGNSWENPICFKSIQHFPITSHIRTNINDSIINSLRINKNFYSLQGKLSIRSINEDSIPSQEKISIVPDSTTPQPPQTNTTDSQIHTIISKLDLLKAASHHSEREHESLVEKFFEYLGYQCPVDIKYRVGHIDILVNANSPNSMVVEVKRDWGLSRKDKEVIDQAFRYATNCGSRFVVITNGDYYAFYDRKRGLSIIDNFDFDFKLSEISDSEIQRLNKYRK